MTTDLEGAVERVKARVSARMAGVKRDLARQRKDISPEAIREAARYATVSHVLVLDLLDTLDALASITRERDAMREAGKPFFDLAKTVTTPAPGSPPWWQESQDWTVVFSFAGCAVTLGDLRRAAALVNGEVG